MAAIVSHFNPKSQMTSPDAYDPIFNGLAIALIFGILVSTLLTLIVIPTLYYAAYQRTLAPHGARS